MFDEFRMKREAKKVKKAADKEDRRLDTLEDLISSLQREVTTLEDFLLRAKSRPATEKGGIPA